MPTAIRFCGMPSHTIRRMTEGDFADCLRVLTPVLSPSLGSVEVEPFLKDFLTPSGGPPLVKLVLTLSHRLAGVAIAKPLAWAPGTATGQCLMAIVPEHRRRGLGGVLFDALVHRALLARITNLRVELPSDAQHHLPFFLARGFHRIESIPLLLQMTPPRNTDRGLVGATPSVAWTDVSILERLATPEP